MPKPIRKLGYADRWQWQIGEDVDTDMDVSTPATFPNQTTPTTLTVQWTQEQYTRILSCLMLGADLSHPLERQQIYYDFIKITNGGVMSCDDVADCIETNESVQDAIIESNQNSNDLYGNINPDFMTNDALNNLAAMDYRFPPAQRNQEMKPLDACNLDELWAGIYFTVQKLDERGRDWLEAIVARVDRWERIADFIGTVPIVGELGENIIGNIIDIIPDVLEFYNAYSTEEHLQEIACRLFELVCEDCRYPTYWEFVLEYSTYAIDGMEDISGLAVKAVMDYLVGSSSVSSQICYYTVITTQLYFMFMGAEFLGLRGHKWLAIWLDNGEEFSNDEWMILCDGCGEVHYYYEVDWTDGDMHGWTTDSSGAIAGIGVSWIAGGSIRYSNAWKVFDAPLDIMRVEMEFQRSNGNNGGGNQNILLSTTGTTSGAFPSPTNHISEDFQPNEIGLRCNSTVPATGARQILMQIKSAPSGSGAHCRKLKIWSTTPATGFVEVSGAIPECP